MKPKKINIQRKITLTVFCSCFAIKFYETEHGVYNIEYTLTKTVSIALTSAFNHQHFNRQITKTVFLAEENISEILL